MINVKIYGSEWDLKPGIEFLEIIGSRDNLHLRYKTAKPGSYTAGEYLGEVRDTVTHVQEVFQIWNPLRDNWERADWLNDKKKEKKLSFSEKRKMALQFWLTINQTKYNSYHTKLDNIKDNSGWERFISRKNASQALEESVRSRIKEYIEKTEVRNILINSKKAEGESDKKAEKFLLSLLDFNN